MMRGTRNHSNLEQQQLKPFTNQQLPLPMQQPMATQQQQRTPEANTLGQTNFMLVPMQQQTTMSLSSTPQCASPFRTFQQNHMPLMSYATAQTAGLPITPRSTMPHGPGLPQLQTSFDQSPAAGVYYEMALRERVESTQLMVQLKESARQLEKSRKDYAKLLSQVDEDQEETAQLKDTVRQQETRISQLTLKQGESELTLERVMVEKSKFEAEGRQATKAYQLLQNELLTLQRRFEKQDNQSGHCKLAEKQLENQVQKRTKEIYDLTVNLGCLQTENEELKRQMEERDSAVEKRHDSSRILIEQKLHDACEQIKELSEAFSTAQDQLVILQAEKMMAKERQREAGVQTKQARVLHIGVQADEDVPRFKHSALTIDVSSPSFLHTDTCSSMVFEMPELPIAAFEIVYHKRFAETDQSFDASIGYMTQNRSERHLEQHLEQQSVDPEQHDSSYSHGDQSLNEFKMLERASQMMHQQSMEMPRLLNLPMVANQRSQLVNKPTTGAILSKPVKKHNFVGNQSQNTSCTIEPKIIRTMPQTTIDISSRLPARFNSHNYMQLAPVQQTAQTTNLDLAMSYLGEANVSEGINPVTQRQQQIAYVNLDESLQQHYGSLNIMQQRSEEGSAEQSSQMLYRRAKSNTDLTATVKTTVPSISCETGKKTRRKRHERKVDALSKKHSTNGDEDDHTSYRSIGVKSSMTTTPLRQRSRLAAAAWAQNLSSRRDSSRLKQPTTIHTSRVLQATLNRIDSEKKIKVTNTQADESMTTCRTPSKNLDVSHYHQPQQQQQYPQFMTKNLRANNSAIRQRPSQDQHTSLGQYHSQTHHSMSAQRSVTPRVHKSLCNLQANAPTHLTRHQKNSLSSSNNLQPQPQPLPQPQPQQPQTQTQKLQLSATARRVAYEQRRKISAQTMKEMKRASSRTNANVNRQARAAIANLSGISAMEEEPCMELPQQAVPPQVMQLSQEDGQYVQIAGSATPREAGADSLSREQILEHRKSKTAIATPVQRCEDDENGPIDENHLQQMKVKLMQIQSNKMLLETKIREYESLITIEHEPNSDCYEKQSDTEKTPRGHIFNKQERVKKRTAFQQIHHNASHANIIGSNSKNASNLNSSSASLGQKSQHERMKGPSHAQNANQPIFRR